MYLLGCLFLLFVVGYGCLRVHGPSDNRYFPELDLAQVADASCIKLKLDRVIANGEFCEDAVADQGLHIPPKSGVADSGLKIKPLGVFFQHQGAANREPAVVMQSKDFYAPNAFCDGLGKSSRLYHIPAVVHVPENGSVAGHNALFFIVLFQLKLDGFILPPAGACPAGCGFFKSQPLSPPIGCRSGSTCT